MRDNRNNKLQDKALVTSWVNSLFSQKCIEGYSVPGETRMI